MRYGGGGREKKGGDGRPLFPYAGERCYRFFPPFFFPPLAAFFAIVSSPLSAWCAAEGLNSALASRPLGLPDPCAKRPGSVANRTSADARSTTCQKRKRALALLPHPPAPSPSMRNPASIDQRDSLVPTVVVIHHECHCPRTPLHRLSRYPISGLSELLSRKM